MKKYIAIYGGTDLTAEIPAFVEKLSFAILTNINGAVIVTGGFEYKTDKNGNRIKGISTDYSAYRGAEKFANENGIELTQCLKTWIPEPEKDRNKEQVTRFKKGDWEIVTGKSAQARRFDMVKRVDAVVTIKGKKNTAMVLDFAIITGKPFLPLAFTGDDSKEYWDENKALIKKTFEMEDKAFEEDLKEFNPANASPEKTDNFINAIIATLEKGLQKICLVLRGYNNESDEFYEKQIKPAVIEKRFLPIDIKEELNRGNILSLFLKKLETSDAILADITEANPNVMYELGQAHARGLQVILYSRKKIDDSLQQRLPFYLSMDKVEHDDCSTIPGIENLITRIKGHLIR